MFVGVFSKQNRNRFRHGAWLSACVSLSTVSHAEGSDPTEACIQAHEAAQKAMHAGRLQEARKDFIRCAQEGCPAVLRSDCSTNLQDIEASIPTVVVRARNGDGADLLDASLYVDGKQLASSLDGRAIEIDPGKHSFRCVDKQGHSSEKPFVVLEGRKNQLVELVLGEPSSAPSESSRPPYLAYGLGALGIVALGSFTYFGLTGKAKERDLDACAPLCERSDYRAMKRDYIVADTSLGIGVVLLVVSTYLFATHEEKPVSARRYDIVPEKKGAKLMLSGSF